MTKTILFSLNDAELQKFFMDLGEPKFRAAQIRSWLNKGAPDFESMKNIPLSLRQKLDSIAQTLPVTIVKKLQSSDGETTKFLLRLHDGEQIECVFMHTQYGNSVCVSSQAGCAMGCKFCASTLLGLKRNLTSDEIFAQILVAQWELRGGASSKKSVKHVDLANDEKPMDTDKKPNGDPNNNDVSHIVIMGTGEPLQNTENVIGFMERANRDMNISWRRITISTCGIVPGIYDLIKWGQPVNLAVSLHAPNDELRSTIMPINNKYKIDEVLTAANDFAKLHNRQLMIEYILLARRDNSASAGNDAISSDEIRLYNCTPEHAQELSKLLTGKNCMVNLIPWNTVDERDFVSPSNNAVHRFQDVLIENKIHVRIRRERGADIGSACGQLRLNNAI